MNLKVQPIAWPLLFKNRTGCSSLKASGWKNNSFLAEKKILTPLILSDTY